MPPMIRPTWLPRQSCLSMDLRSQGMSPERYRRFPRKGTLNSGPLTPPKNSRLLSSGHHMSKRPENAANPKKSLPWGCQQNTYFSSGCSLVAFSTRKLRTYDTISRRNGLKYVFFHVALYTPGTESDNAITDTYTPIASPPRDRYKMTGRATVRGANTVNTGTRRPATSITFMTSRIPSHCGALNTTSALSVRSAVCAPS
mmetsp:Transcript_13318/g.30834  ORF Transcript_13318/g.30834 Transcript_13318/m.30834 type:complete len:200 (-) Transcript_13318:257-856(-)